MGNGAKTAQIVAIVLAIELIFSLVVRMPITYSFGLNDISVETENPTPSDPEVYTPVSDPNNNTTSVTPTAVPTTSPDDNPVNISDDNTVNELMWDYNPYYELLDETDKNIYKDIYNCLKNAETSIDIEKYQIAFAKLKLIAEYAYFDHPEIFWYEGAFQYQYDMHTGKVVSYEPNYSDLAKDIENNREKINQKAEEYIVAAKAETRGDVYKELVVHDMLCKNITYVIDSDYNQSVYSSLVNGKTVCAGYSRAFQYIMLKLGINVCYVSGDANNGKAVDRHSWNIVKLDGNYYNVDVTWDDLDNEKLLYYEYFNLTDDQIDDDHFRGEVSKGLPQCTSTELAYKNIAA